MNKKNLLIRIGGFLIIGILSVKVTQYVEQDGLNAHRKIVCNTYKVTKGLSESYESELNSATDAEYTKAKYEEVQIKYQASLKRLEQMDKDYQCQQFLSENQ